MISKIQLFKSIAVACTALFGASAAHAVTTTFDFSGNGGTAPSYSFTSGGLTVNVTAASYNGSAWTNALVGQYSGGLGVTNSQKNQWGSPTDTNSPQHAVDNNGWKDLLIFSFSLPVDVDALTIGWYSSDSDFRYSIGNTGAGVTVLTGTGVNGTGSNTYLINGANTFGSYFSVAAGKDLQYWNESNDYFKVDKLKVTYNKAPDQASTLALTSLAVVGLLAFRRRQTRDLS